MNPDPKAVTIESPCCRYIPHIAVAREGQTFVFNNTAPVPHNPKFSSRLNGEYNPLVAPKSPFVVNKLKAEKFPIEIACSIHPWMKSTVVVSR